MRLPRSLNPAHRPAKARRWVIGVLVGLVVLVLAGPTLLSLTPIPASLVAGALPPEAGALTTDSVSLSWAGPIAVEGIEVRDPDGAVVATVGSARVDGGLLAIASQGGPLDVAVEGVRADIVVRADGGTNLDPIVNALKREQDAAQQADGPAAAADAPTPRRAVRVALRDVAVRLTDESTGSRWVAEGIEATVDDPGRGVNALRVKASGELATLAGPDAAAVPERARLAVEVGPAEGGVSKGRLRVERAPLAVVAPLLRRNDPRADLSGWADVAAEATWDPNTPIPDTVAGPAAAFRTLLAGGVRVSGEARLSAVVFKNAATRGDPVRLASVVAPLAARAEGDRLVIESAEATSDVGRVGVTGAISVADVDRWSAGVAALPSDLRVQGNVELAALGRSAPGALADRERPRRRAAERGEPHRRRERYGRRADEGRPR